MIQEYFKEDGALKCHNLPFLNRKCKRSHSSHRWFVDGSSVSDFRQTRLKDLNNHLFLRWPFSNAAECNVSHSTQGRDYNSTDSHGVNTIPVECINPGGPELLGTRGQAPFIRLTRKTMWPLASDGYAILSSYRNATHIPCEFSGQER